MLSAKEKKKEVLPSPRRMIKVHADSTTDDDNIDKTNELDDIAVEQVQINRFAPVRPWTPLSPSIAQVHTVNDWEHADLGDEQRKQKFLRLMGAKVNRPLSAQNTRTVSPRRNTRKRTQPTERIRTTCLQKVQLHRRRSTAVRVRCCSAHHRPRTASHLFVEIENETIDRELEKQFNESLQSKILHTHHEGLGFCERESAPDESDHRPATKFVRGTTETGDSQHKSSR